MTQTKTCSRCGQAVNMLQDSYNMPAPGQVQHVTCPTSDVIRAAPELAAVATAAATGDGQGEELPRFLTIQEAAGMLRCSESTVRRYVRLGTLPAKRLRGTGSAPLLFALRDVLALLVDAGPA